MENIDRYILVALLQGNVTSDQAYYRTCNVAGEEVRRDIFEARLRRLREENYVGIQPDRTCGYRTYATNDGCEVFYAELRKSCTTPPPALMQEAARLIEIDGEEAFETVRRLFGESVALLLLVAHLRRGFGAMNAHPPDPEIDHKVTVRLQELGLLG